MLKVLHLHGIEIELIVFSNVEDVAVPNRVTIGTFSADKHAFSNLQQQLSSWTLTNLVSLSAFLPRINNPHHCIPALGEQAEKFLLVSNYPTNYTSERSRAPWPYWL